MDNRYGDDYNGSYIPRGPPSYAGSNPPQVNGSYSGSIPRGPPSFAGSVPRPYDNNEKEFDANSHQSKDMSRYPRDNKGDYTQYNSHDSDRGSNRPDNDRYYNDRDRPPMEPGRDSYDDHGSYRRDPNDDRRDPYYDDRGREPHRDDRRYDDRSESYNGKPYDQASYRQDSGSYRYDDRPPPRGGGKEFSQYDDEYDSRGDPRSRIPQENGATEVDDVRLNERDANPRYAAQTGAVELAYAPPEAKAKKKPVLKELKPKVIKEKWKNKPPRERKKYCALFTFLILAAICIIVVPMAIYVRLWHKLTWQDIRNLQVEPRNIKWGQHGQYVYYRDFSNNVIEVDLINHSWDPIFTFEQWNKAGYDDFDVTGHNRLLILAKNNGTKFLHMNFVDLYKYKIGDTNNEPQKFERNVVHWSIASHSSEDRLVFVQQDQPSNCYNIRLHELGPVSRTLKNIGEVSTKPSVMRGVLSYLYSEEFYGKSSQGFWVSQNGDYIVYMITDTSNMSPISVQSPEDPEKEIVYNYPTVQNNKNPLVRLRMYDVLRGEIITGADEALNPLGKQDREYITSVSFPNAKKLLVEFMNREQTRATTEECTLNLSPTCEDLRVLRRNSHLGWLPRYPAVAFPAQEDLSTQQYYVLRPRVDKQFNFTHLHKYETTNDPNRKIAITTGEYAVTELIGNDYTRKHVLYVRTEVLNPTHERTASTRKRMLWMYNDSASGEAQHTCISCLEPDDRCEVATATIDSSMHWYQIFCLGPGVPYVRVKSFANNTYNIYADDQANIQYQDPSKQAQLLQKKSPSVQYTQVELDKNTNIYVAVKKIFPLYYVKHANILKYPLLIWVDPNPEGNMAMKKYKLDLAQWLATSKDCVVVYMDVKGTPGRGLAFHHWPYKDFTRLVNKAEQAIRDIKMYWHVNDNKVAIMGEKMGGWLALKMVERQPDWFKAAIAVNPILNFEHYIQAFSERYLDKYTAGQTSSIYPSAAMDLTKLSTEIRKKTAIYYDPRNYEVPSTYQTMKPFLEGDKTTDLENFNLFNIMDVEEGLEDKVLGDVFLDIGLNVTAFLEESPHNIF